MPRVPDELFEPELSVDVNACVLSIVLPTILPGSIEYFNPCIECFNTGHGNVAPCDGALATENSPSMGLRVFRIWKIFFGGETGRNLTSLLRCVLYERNDF